MKPYRTDARPGDLVRVNPKFKDRRTRGAHWQTRRSPHYQIALVLTVSKRHVIVRPRGGHGRNEKVAHEAIKLWRRGAATTKAELEERLRKG